VSDADRDAAVSELGDHFQAGRITAAELDERAGLAITAQTGKDLADLLADLPAGTAVLPRPVAAARSGAAVSLRLVAGRWWPFMVVAVLAGIAAVTAVMAGAQGHGRWAPWWLIGVGFFLLRRLGWSRRARMPRDRGE
jgi:hypothetical protein